MFTSFAGMPPDATQTVMAVALYVSPLPPAAWRRMGPAGVAAYTATALAAPDSRLPALVGVVLTAHRAGTLTDPARWAAAHRAACRVTAGPTQHTAQPRSAQPRSARSRGGRSR